MSSSIDRERDTTYRAGSDSYDANEYLSEPWWQRNLATLAWLGFSIALLVAVCARLPEQLADWIEHEHGSLKFSIMTHALMLLIGQHLGRHLHQLRLERRSYAGETRELHEQLMVKLDELLRNHTPLQPVYAEARLSESERAPQQTGEHPRLTFAAHGRDPANESEALTRSGTISTIDAASDAREQPKRAG